MIEYWIIYAVLMAIDYQQKFQSKQLEIAQIEGKLSNARLNALRFQLQPHFLFNTLNTISSLMEIDVKKGQKIVSELGNLLRFVLEKEKKHIISLKEELDFVKSYLDIEEVRFHDRLNIDYQIDKSILDTQIPSLLLQPLVENAIKHGFSNRPEGGSIELHARPYGDGILLRVKDDGNGLLVENNEQTSRGIGLNNVKERLELLYKDQYRFEINTSPGNGFEVSIYLPSQPLSS